MKLTSRNPERVTHPHPPTPRTTSPSPVADPDGPLSSHLALEDWMKAERALIVATINVRSLAKRIGDLRQLEIGKLCSILCLTEIWDVPDHMNVKITGMNLVAKDVRKGRGGGVAIYISKTMDVTELPSRAVEGVEHAGVSLSLVGRKYEFHVVYRCPSGNLERLNDVLKDILDNANGAVTITGDMNIDWIGTDSKHEKWREGIRALGLKNEMSEITRCAVDRDSCLDHVYVTHDKTCGSKTEELHLADHRAVFMAMSVSSRAPKTSKTCSVLQTGEGPVALLRLHLREIDWNLAYDEGASVDDNFDRFFAIIDELVKNFV